METPPTPASTTKHELEQYMILPDAWRHRDLLKSWHDHAANLWPHVALLARLFAGVDGTTSSQVERNLSDLSAPLDSLRTTMTEDKWSRLCSYARKKV